jgi:hypothetical protein
VNRELVLLRDQFRDCDVTAELGRTRSSPATPMSSVTFSRTPEPPKRHARPAAMTVTITYPDDRALAAA